MKNLLARSSPHSKALQKLVLESMCYVSAVRDTIQAVSQGDNDAEQLTRKLLDEQPAVEAWNPHPKRLVDAQDEEYVRAQ